MEQINVLRATLIRRFLILIVLISIAEYIIFRILNVTIIPYISAVFYKRQDPAGLGMEAILMAFLLSIGSILMQLVEIFLPGKAAMNLSGLRMTWENRLSDIMSGTQSGDAYLLLSTPEKIFVIIFIMFTLIVMALPYIVGATIYSTRVIKDLKAIEASEREKEKEYEKRRNLMLSDIAHDLRTPMTTVSGYTRALADGMVPPDKIPEYYDAIRRKSGRMDELINLLFDYVRLGSDGFTLCKTPTDLCELVRECAAMQYQDVEDAGMNFDVDIPEERLQIEADRLQISRVVTNLITNAVKHNDKGCMIGVIVKKELNRYRVIVADTGKPIDADRAATIFEPFVMGDESRSTRGGSGLGLSIAKKVVEMHGYDIKLIQGSRTAKYGLSQEYTKAFVITIKV